MARRDSVWLIPAHQKDVRTPVRQQRGRPVDIQNKTESARGHDAIAVTASRQEPDLRLLFAASLVSWLAIVIGIAVLF